MDDFCKTLENRAKLWQKVAWSATGGGITTTAAGFYTIFHYPIPVLWCCFAVVAALLATFVGVSILLDLHYGKVELNSFQYDQLNKRILELSEAGDTGLRDGICSLLSSRGYITKFDYNWFDSMASKRLEELKQNGAKVSIIANCGAAKESGQSEP